MRGIVWTGADVVTAIGAGVATGTGIGISTTGAGVVTGTETGAAIVTGNETGAGLVTGDNVVGGGVGALVVPGGCVLFQYGFLGGSTSLISPPCSSNHSWVGAWFRNSWQRPYGVAAGKPHFSRILSSAIRQWQIILSRKAHDSAPG